MYPDVGWSGGLERRGDDLHSWLEVDVFSCLLGGTVAVDTVRGRRLLDVPPGEGGAREGGKEAGAGALGMRLWSCEVGGLRAGESWDVTGYGASWRRHGAGGGGRVTLRWPRTYSWTAVCSQPVHVVAR